VVSAANSSTEKAEELLPGRRPPPPEGDEETIGPPEMAGFSLGMPQPVQRRIDLLMNVFM
jgi:hypothetical protein